MLELDRRAARLAVAVAVHAVGLARRCAAAASRARRDALGGRAQPRELVAGRRRARGRRSRPRPRRGAPRREAQRCRGASSRLVHGAASVARSCAAQGPLEPDFTEVSQALGCAGPKPCLGFIRLPEHLENSMAQAARGVREIGEPEPHRRRGLVGRQQLLPRMRVLGHPRGLPARVLVRPPAGRPACLLADHVLRAHVRDHRRLPPLLRAQDLQDQPRLPVRARRARLLGDAEGRALVGRPPPQPPQVRRPPGRDVHSPQGRLLVLAPGLDLRRSLGRDAARPHPRLRALPRAGVAEPLAPACRRSLLAVACCRRSAASRACSGASGLDRAALARDLLDQLARAPLGHAPLRHARHQPQQLAARRCSRSARAGTTTTTTTARRRARASSGGRSTSPTTCCARWPPSAWSGTCASRPPTS